jgi:hypothetical protein
VCDLDRAPRAFKVLAGTALHVEAKKDGVEVLAPASLRTRMRELEELLVAKLLDRGDRTMGGERSVAVAR